ncbi:MAG: MFS transporter [Actinomycetota bacterium]
MERGAGTVTRRWPDTTEARERLLAPRDDIVAERRLVAAERDDAPAPGEARPERSGAVLARFEQEHGPFEIYARRVLQDGDGELVEVTTHRTTIPWFAWLYGPAVRAVLRRRISYSGWWAPPDRLDATQVLVIGLLAAASMTAAFVNTLFTQTAEFAADDFGVGSAGIGNAGAVVRAGIVFALPAAFLADRIGRRRVAVWLAVLAPVLSVLGAAAPSFEVLTATQALARPMGIALAFVIGVIAAEEMPRNTRAYAISVMAMAAGFGAGVAVMSLRLADVGEGGWRLVYLVAAIWCIVAVDLARRLPETRRFLAHQPEQSQPRRATSPDFRRRLALLAAVAFGGNVFVAPASFFQNSYLEDVRGFSGGMIGLFSIVVGTPAGIGLIIGGRIADQRGRRAVIATALPLSVLAVLAAFTYGGWLLWLSSFFAATLGAMVYPAMVVYRSELFPTANRTRASAFITTSALLGGIGGLIATGQLIDRGWSYPSVMSMLAIGQLVVTVLVVAFYPETAHRELEELNPEDAGTDLPTFHGV